MKRLKQSKTTERSLNEKTVVITGASSGVGRAAAFAFARQRAKLVLAARRQPALDEVVKECMELGAKAIAVTTDVTDTESVRRLAATAIDFGGRIDVWINNAGVLAAGGFTETPIEIHDQVIRTNLLGYLHGAYAVLPYFKQQQYGVLINHISVGGWFPTPYAVGYSASKFELRGFSEALRGELGDWPAIHVCDLFPAFLDTPGILHAGNYTGRVLKPAPPVYDPQRVAKAMVSLAQHPKQSVTIGSVATILRLAHFLLPALTAALRQKLWKTTLKLPSQYLLQAVTCLVRLILEQAYMVDGNSKAAHAKKIASTLIISGVAAAFILMRKSK